MVSTKAATAVAPIAQEAPASPTPSFVQVTVESSSVPGWLFAVNGVLVILILIEIAWFFKKLKKKKKDAKKKAKPGKEDKDKGGEEKEDKRNNIGDRRGDKEYRRKNRGERIEEKEERRRKI